jgi:hypothetical protein
MERYVNNCRSTASEALREGLEGFVASGLSLRAECLVTARLAVEDFWPAGCVAAFLTADLVVADVAPGFVADVFLADPFLVAIF